MSHVVAGVSRVGKWNVDNSGVVVDNLKLVWISEGVIHNLRLKSVDNSGDNCGNLWIGTG